MARYKEAPYGFKCPYLHKRPHLGISAVYASAMLSDIERDEFRNGHALIEAMKEIDALNEEISEEWETGKIYLSTEGMPA